jgi:2-dehydropantoate 2-reductase
MWEKFVFIAAISGVGAAARSPLGVVRSVPETRSLLAQAMGEIAAVARGLGIQLPGDVVSRILANIDGMPAGVYASMQRDMLDGRPSELDSQLGAVVRLGRQAGVETPGHAALYAVLLPQEKRARGEITF